MKHCKIHYFFAVIYTNKVHANDILTGLKKTERDRMQHWRPKRLDYKSRCKTTADVEAILVTRGAVLHRQHGILVYKSSQRN
jgi:hypothetical protein